MTTWITVTNYHGTVGINASESSDEQINDFLTKHEARKVAYWTRPDGIHWDGYPINE